MCCFRKLVIRPSLKIGAFLPQNIPYKIHGKEDFDCHNVSTLRGSGLQIARIRSLASYTWKVSPGMAWGSLVPRPPPKKKGESGEYI